jgi:hypothetical protein
MTGDQFAAHMKVVARKLLGEPNRRLSNGHDLRFGTNGSLTVDLKKGTFYSHEDNDGGGVLGLIKRVKGLSGRDAVAWMRNELGLDIPHDEGAHKIVATYDYRDEDGALLFQVVRFDPKDFRQRRPDGAGDWIWSTKGVKQVPYRLPEMSEAIALNRPIVIVEGEKVADALWALNIPATCNAGGAGKWSPALNQYFRDADVVISPDNDPPARNSDGTLRLKDRRPIFPGQDHALDVAQKLSRVADRIRILELPGLPPKGDAFDWIAAGGTAEQFWQLIETQAVPHNKYQGPTATNGPAADRFELIALDDIKIDDDPVDLIEGLLPTGPALHVVYGPPKSFKSFLLQHIYLHIAAGLYYADHKVLQGAVVYVTNEGVRGVKRRLVAM